MNFILGRIFPCRNQPIAIKKHSPLLQLSLAVVQTLRSKTHYFERLAAIEKTILQGFQDDDEEDEEGLGHNLGENMILRLLKEFKKSDSGDGNDDGGYGCRCVASQGWI